MSLRQLKADMKPIKHWWPDGPAPYLLGGLLGVPVGLAILSSLPTADLMLEFGGFPVLYAGYSLLRPHGVHATVRGSWLSSSFSGMCRGGHGGENPGARSLPAAQGARFTPPHPHTPPALR